MSAWARRDLARPHRVDQGAAVGATIGALAVESLVQRHAKAELIGPRVDATAEVLFGGHVGRRAHHDPDLGQLRRQQLLGPGRLRRNEGPFVRGGLFTAGLVLGRGPCQPEVRHPHPAVGTQQHIRGFEVPMNHAMGMRRRQPATGLVEHRQHFTEVAARRTTPVGQGLALDVLHDDEDLVALRADLVHRDDVRV